jgi:hypothetical protein
VSDPSPPTPLSEEVATEVRQTLHDLASVRLAPSAWPAVAGDLARLDAAVAARDERSIRAALVPIAQAAFEGKVRGRLAGKGSRTPAIVPTKRTAALPVVGAVCAALLMGLGYLIGGGVVLAATAALALFVLAVALAGTRAARVKADALRDRRLAPSAERTDAAPTVVRSAIVEIERHLA